MKKVFLFVILSISTLGGLFVPGKVSLAADQFTGFTISPGIIEEWFNPGDSKTKTIYIKNDLGKPATFDIELEDFETSPDPMISTNLLGEKKGPYSLRDYLKPEVSEITIQEGKTIPLHVQISIPKDATLPGFYGAVLAKPRMDKKNAESTEVYPRLGTLFYIGIEGNSTKKSELVGFKYMPAGSCQGDCDVDDSVDMFEVTFQNNDKVHISLVGDVEIKNIFGKVVDKIGVGPWYVMPNCEKIKEAKWSNKSSSMFGIYTASLKLSDNHDGSIKEKKVYIWAFPWKTSLVLILFALAIFLAIKFFGKHFRLIRTDEKLVCKPKNKAKTKK